MQKKKTEKKTRPRNHFLQCCKSTSIKTDKILIITNIRYTTYTFPSIIIIIIQGLTSYYNNHDTTYTPSFTNKDLNIAQHQNAIGWDNFAPGIISKIFQRVISRHYKLIKSTHIPTL